MASRALLSVCWRRRAVAWVRYRVWSALVIAGFLAGRDRFEPGDDAFQVVLDQAEIGGQAGLAVGVGAGDQAQVDRGLAAVGVEEFRSGLEVGAGQAGVGVGAVLLGAAGRSSRWAGCS
jgi:hypothetical protein